MWMMTCQRQEYRFMYWACASAPGEGKGNPLQFSTFGIPWTEEPGRLQSMESQESDMTYTTTTICFSHRKHLANASGGQRREGWPWAKEGWGGLPGKSNTKTVLRLHFHLTGIIKPSALPNSAWQGYFCSAFLPPLLSFIIYLDATLSLPHFFFFFFFFTVFPMEREAHNSGPHRKL